MSTVPLLSGLYQIAYVAADLGAGTRQLAAIYGIDRFRVKHDVLSAPGMPDMVVHQAHVFIGSVQIELIQPAGGDDVLYRDFCAADPAAIRHHHFGKWVDDPMEYRRLPGALAQHDNPITFEMSVPGVGGAIYADTRRTWATTSNMFICAQRSRMRITLTSRGIKASDGHGSAATHPREGRTRRSPTRRPRCRRPQLED